MEHDCPFIILLSGTPGTGKTTLARDLCEKYGWKSFALGTFVIENEYYVSENKINDLKTIDVDKVSQLGAREFLAKYMDSSVTIIDSHYADIIMDGFLDLEQKENGCITNYLKGNDIVGIVLRCHPKILLKRLNERNYTPSKIMENLQAEILSESTNNLLEVLSEEHILEISTGNRSISEISTIIYDWYSHKFEKKISRKSELQKIGNIDWIKELSEEGTLNSYFKEDFGDKKVIEMEELGDEKY